ncbi:MULTISPECIES: hypothetical protein [Cysteiniphilum]|uniref:hypothetical protein n=1 Tax=Cysteiniphilum TaxID=2056696 RepID=UPI001782BE04|nr:MULTISPECIES: hypothetical protein [Cysteiniphilum]
MLNKEARMKYICFMIVFVFLMLNVKKSYLAVRVVTPEIVDMQHPATVYFSESMDQITNVSGQNVSMLSNSEQALTENGRYVVWKKQYVSAYPLLKSVPDFFGKDEIRQALKTKTLQKVKLNARFGYGAQIKDLDILLLGYIMEFSSTDHSSIMVDIEERSCVLWQQKQQGKIQVAFKAGCASESAMIRGDKGWKKALKGIYFGMSTEGIKQLKGGQWRLVSAIVSPRISLAVKSIINRHSKELSAKLADGNNMQFSFHFPPNSLTLNIPYFATLQTLSGESQPQIELINSLNNEGDYTGGLSGNRLLHFKTNQSIIGVNIMVECDTKIEDDEDLLCGLYNKEKDTYNKLLLEVNECDALGVCADGQGQWLSPHKTVRLNHLDTSFFELNMLAPGLAKNASGDYVSTVTIMAKAEF